MAIFIFLSCKPKQNSIDYKETQNNIIMNEKVLDENEIIKYVGSFNGLDLREEYGIESKIIKTLKQNTKLFLQEKSQKKDTINELEDYWFKVDTGTEVGWVFGAYLTSKANLENIGMEKPILMVNESAILEFPNLRVEKVLWDYYFYKIDKIKIYDIKNKETNFLEIINERVYLYKLPETSDWLYLVTQDLRNHGFIYIYDISEESYYGNLEEKAKSGNEYERQLSTEYNILRKHQNAKRYGPLLEITYENKIIKILDNFNGIKSSSYQLLDYYKEYNEILIRQQFYEGAFNSIYNLQLNDYVCDIGSFPQFNESRNYVFSIHSFYGNQNSILYIYSIRDGVYEKICEEVLFKNINNASSNSFTNLEKGYWTSDYEFLIESAENNILQVKLNGKKFELNYK
jgi:hypothetical protein